MLTTSPTTELHACAFVHKFTGKERDAESGLDYFGARYYGSSMGRFMSPDWNARAVPVPYASLGNPQSLNLYAYVGNNPLSHRDVDGHHQECAPDTSRTEKDGSTTVIAGACHEVADHWWQIPSAWWKNQRAQTERYLATNPHPTVKVGIVFPFGVGGAAGGVEGEALEGTEAETGTEAESTEAPTGTQPKTLQTGGNSISNQTAKGLNEGTGQNLSSREWGRAIEELKSDNGLGNATHGQIMSNGDYVVNGNTVGNITHYIP
jgi:RHS repeat-associated protein